MISEVYSDMLSGLRLGRYKLDVPADGDSISAATPQAKKTQRLEVDVRHPYISITREDGADIQITSVINEAFAVREQRVNTFSQSVGQIILKKCEETGYEVQNNDGVHVDVPEALDTVIGLVASKANYCPVEYVL